MVGVAAAVEGGDGRPRARGPAGRSRLSLTQSVRLDSCVRAAAGRVGSGRDAFVSNLAVRRQCQCVLVCVCEVQ